MLYFAEMSKKYNKCNIKTVRYTNETEFVYRTLPVLSSQTNPSHILYGAACQWHAFSADRSGELHA